MMLVVLLATAVAMGQVEKTPPDEPANASAPKESAADARRWVRELDGAQKAVRDQAEKALLEMGPDALAYLPEVTERTPAELGLRLKRIRGKLEEARAKETIEPTAVTLKADSMKLSEVLARIEEQTGNKALDYREQFGQEGQDLPLTLSLEKTPYWQALDQVLDQAKLTIYGTPDPDEAGDALTLVRRGETRAPRFGQAVYSGPFRFEATEIVARRDRRDPGNNDLQVTLEASWEPRLKPIVIYARLADFQAKDDAGVPVSLVGSEEDLEFNVAAGGKSIEFPLRFMSPSRDKKQLASLKGRLEALIPGRLETYRFERIEKLKASELRQGGVTVALDEIEKNNELWEFRMRVIFDDAEGTLESHRNWVFDTMAHLEGPNKELVEAVSREATSEDENECGMSFLFAVDSLEGHAFVYETPAAVARAPIDFELLNLELP